MITYLRGNLLEDDAQALVNTVNTVGVMGKGIALQFKQRFPANFVAYALACKLGQVQTGRMFVTEPGELTGPRWVVNFPTKQHWRDPSRMEWVVDGLQDLRGFLIDLPPINRTSQISKKSIHPENDGHENKQIQRRADHWLSAPGRGRHADQGDRPQARL